MKTRHLAMSTMALGLVLTFAGCGNDDPKSSDQPTESETTSASPTPSATTTSPTRASTTAPTTSPTTKKTKKPAGKYAKLAGTWEHKDPEFWTLHFKANGTFIEDFDGVKEIRTGKFTVKGSKFLLMGGDGDTSTGTLKGNTLTFGEEVLTKK